MVAKASTIKQSVLDKASGQLGTAIAARIVRDFGNVQAFAKRIGYSPWSVWRWVQNEIAPSAEAAACLTTIYPELQPLLEAKGCYKGRARPPLGSRAETKAQAQARIADAQRQAAAFADDHQLPRASPATKVARRPIIALLAASRAERAKQTKRRARAVVRQVNHRRGNDVRHSGDFIERLDEMTASDARLTPSYAMEER